MKTSMQTASEIMDAFHAMRTQIIVTYMERAEALGVPASIPITLEEISKRWDAVRKDCYGLYVERLSSPQHFDNWTPEREREIQAFIEQMNALSDEFRLEADRLTRE